MVSILDSLTDTRWNDVVSVIDPLTDPRWDALLDRHPRASVFHSIAWLEALKRTYGFEPMALTTTPEGPLENGMLFCRVARWWSSRLVSLPFSDHCEPLVDRPEDLSAMFAFLNEGMKKGLWRSLELRPRSLTPVQYVGSGFSRIPTPSASYCLHTLDLRPSAERIFAGFHPSSTRRAVRRAEREGLTYESGTSESLLSAFYGLLRLTRRRHGLPPQPIAWFRNLLACFSSTHSEQYVGSGFSRTPDEASESHVGSGFSRTPDDASESHVGSGFSRIPEALIHVARKDGRPVASILTLSFKNALVYKYGGSDARYHRLGAMPFLFWRAIQAAKSQGLEELDLGRSDLDQPGLLAFKDHLGASRSSLSYYTSPERRKRASYRGPVSRVASRILTCLPDAALDLTGRLVYRRLG